MSILKRVSAKGKTTYLVRVFLSEDYSTGKQKMISKSFEVYKEARAWKAQMESSRSTGTLVEPKALTLAEYSKEWLDSTARDDLKIQTVELYQSLFKNHINPALGGRQLQKLTVREVKKLLEDLQKKKASKSTLRNVCGSPDWPEQGITQAERGKLSTWANPSLAPVSQTGTRFLRLSKTGERSPLACEAVGGPFFFVREKT